MGPSQTLMHISDALIIWTFLASAGFVILYHVTAKWWGNAFGKSLMTYQIAMTMVLGLSIVRIILGGTEHPIFMYLRLAVFAVVPLALTWRIVVLVRLQRKEKGRDDGS